MLPHSASAAATAAALLHALVAGAWAAPLDAVRVDPATGHFVDSHGRTRIFHGVNAVYKEPPWYPPSDRFTPTDSLDPATVRKLREWGFNVVRLGVMWPGVEPSPGAVDRGYLAAVGGLMRDMAEQGVYTLADLHQDVGSRRFCGEGFPEHYVDALLRDPNSRLSRARLFPAPAFPLAQLPLNASGFPALADCLKNHFVKYYRTDQVAALWEQLYTPGTQLHEGFLRFWAAVASAFADAPHVLAFDLLNEPSGFCIGKKCRGAPADLLPEVLGNEVEARFLAPLYRAAAREIRAAGAAQTILYEPTVFPTVGVDIFPEPALGADTQQGLSYHIYCSPGDGNSTAAGILCAGAQAVFERDYFSFLGKYPSLGGFMTEFGDVGGSPRELEHMDWLLGAADEHLQSWAYWQLKTYRDFTTSNPQESLYDAKGRLNVPKLRTLSRTYAPAIAGRPSRMAFDPATAAFDLAFNASVASAPTEIYLNEQLHYPHGFSMEVVPARCLRASRPERNRLLLALADPAACLGRPVEVRVRADAPPALMV